jgi:hypothetical protein
VPCVLRGLRAAANGAGTIHSITLRLTPMALARELCRCHIGISASAIAGFGIGDIVPALPRKDAGNERVGDLFFAHGHRRCHADGPVVRRHYTRRRTYRTGRRAAFAIFLTPILVHFGVVFLISLLALSPEGASLNLPFGLIGFAGLVYSVSIAVKTARSDRLFADAWLFHGAIPIICYVGVITVAWLGVTSTRQAYSVLRAVSALLLLTGMRNAWAAAVDIAQRKSK